MSEGLCSKREPEVGPVAHVGRVERALLRLAAHGVLAQLVIRGQGALGVRVPVREHGGDVLPWQELDVLVLVVGVVLVLGVIEGGADAVGQIVIEAQQSSSSALSSMYSAMALISTPEYSPSNETGSS